MKKNLMVPLLRLSRWSEELGKKKILDLRLLIITPSQWLCVYNGGMKLHNEIIGFGSIEQLGKMRDMIINWGCRLWGLARMWDFMQHFAI
jgi:hypothetical protein